jgi:hypothetical protein
MISSLDTNCKDYLSLAGSKKPRQRPTISDNNTDSLELNLEHLEVGR